jgi:hypothetical protein
MQNVYEYIIQYCNWETGIITWDVIAGIDDQHAYEEATYECPGEIISVTKGEFLYTE